MKISFFKTGKPKEFSYKPLYYDKRKEELDNIKKSVQGESGSDATERMRLQLERSWRGRRDRQRQKTNVSMWRLFIYLAAIGLVLYFLYFARIF